MDSGDSANVSGVSGGGLDVGADGGVAGGQYGGYMGENCDLDDSLGAGGGVSDNNESGNESSGMTGKRYAALREQDRFLPIANVARIMKISIPKTGKIAKDAKECVQECVSEFVSFITSEASDRCHQEKRKTINGEDILFAMSSLGFDNYVAPLKLYLNKYREAQKGEKGSGGTGGGTAEGSNPTDESSLPNDAFSGESISFFIPNSQISS